MSHRLIGDVIPVDSDVAGCLPRQDERINGVVACLNLMYFDKRRQRVPRVQKEKMVK